MFFLKQALPQFDKFLLCVEGQIAQNQEIPNRRHEFKHFAKWWINQISFDLLYVFDMFSPHRDLNTFLCWIDRFFG